MRGRGRSVWKRTICIAEEEEEEEEEESWYRRGIDEDITYFDLNRFYQLLL
jgi:hypothetical protein